MLNGELQSTGKGLQACVYTVTRLFRGGSFTTDGRSLHEPRYEVRIGVHSRRSIQGLIGSINYFVCFQVIFYLSGIALVRLACLTAYLVVPICSSHSYHLFHITPEYSSHLIANMADKEM